MCESQVQHHREDASSLWKAGLCQTFFILADAENSGCTSQVLTSHFFFLRKKRKCWLWFALKGNRIKGNRRNGGKVRLMQEMAVKDQRVCGEVLLHTNPFTERA